MGDSAAGPAAIPLTVNIAAYYVDGHLGVETPANLETKFPHAKYGWCSIDVTGAGFGASVRDWENGDKGGSLEQWVKDHNLHTGKKDAVVYCNVSTIPEVRQLTGTQILGTDYFLWIATLDGTLFGPQQYPHVIANQVRGAKLTGGDYDLSLVFDASFWQPVAPPKPRVTPQQAHAAIAQAEGGLAQIAAATAVLSEYAAQG